MYQGKTHNSTALFDSGIPKIQKQHRSRIRILYTFNSRLYSKGNGFHTNNDSIHNNIMEENKTTYCAYKNHKK